MSEAGYVLLGFALFFVALAWFFRGSVQNLSAAAAEHAKNYSGAYAKVCFLVLLAAATQFDDTFKNLTADEAAKLTWWGWCVLFVKPFSAGLTTIIAFMDQSVARATAARAEKTASGNTTAPMAVRQAAVPIV